MISWSRSSYVIPVLQEAVVGCADAGMGTLLDVLTHGEWNNEHGFTCQVLFHHMHEIESGHTISVGNDIMCFDLEGQVVNKPDIHGGTLDQNLREAFRCHYLHQTGRT
uniref:Uncharacterized protein n=1 Tax=Scleropages formosus TaxID=113540 RepID=A0A8C9RBL4_SCLFO